MSDFSIITGMMLALVGVFVLRLERFGRPDVADVQRGVCLAVLGPTPLWPCQSPWRSMGFFVAFPSLAFLIHFSITYGGLHDLETVGDVVVSFLGLRSGCTTPPLA